jgi:protein tyrosine phosphatase (PTP) superfamily phosphohydrolase (DUF442 family)
MSVTDPLAQLYNYRRLSDAIVTAGQPTVEQFHTVAEQGIEVVINLGLADADYALPDERGLVQSLGLAYEHIPVEWEQPQIEDFEQFVDCMRRHEYRKRLVHCAANKRVSAFMALYRVLEKGRPIEQAMEDLEALWQPNPIWQNFIARVLKKADNLSDPG